MYRFAFLVLATSSLLIASAARRVQKLVPGINS